MAVAVEGADAAALTSAVTAQVGGGGGPVYNGASAATVGAPSAQLAPTPASVQHLPAEAQVVPETVLIHMMSASACTHTMLLRAKGRSGSQIPHPSHCGLGSHMAAFERALFMCSRAPSCTQAAAARQQAAARRR